MYDNYHYRTTNLFFRIFSMKSGVLLKKLDFLTLEVAMTTEFSLSDNYPSPEALAITLEKLVTKQLSPHTRRAYRQDAGHFVEWLTREGLKLSELTKNDIAQYRRYLSDSFAKATASRKLVVARKLLDEAVERNLLAFNPAQGVKGFSDERETNYNALDREGARLLLSKIDTTSLQGKRDYALVMLLLRTGLRRGECADLRLGDLEQEQGHQIAVIRHAKGDKRRKVKIPVDVMRLIDDYLEATNRKGLGPEAPLFGQFHKGDRPYEAGISGQLIRRVVEHYAQQANLKLTPHGLRATFVTLALEGGARLHQVQYVVGHADPRTTERYQKRKLNLDDNGVDYIKL